uniref:BCNT-C domain-containing protein n=1 Tax=Haptolina brevifila TaxID=156173 RepID=A0A7S2IG15_9EUKA
MAATKKGGTASKVKAAKAGSKRATATKPSKAKEAKRPRGGGIALEEEEEEVELAGKASDAAEPETAAKPSVDDMWASMNAGVGASARKQPASAPPSAAPAAAPAAASGVDALWAELQSSSTNGGGASKVASGSRGGSGSLDIKALLAKTGGSSSAPKDTVQIKETVDFCGEDVTITKTVKAGSKEELAYRQGAADALSTKRPKEDAVSSAFAASAELRRQMLGQPAVQKQASSSSLAPPVRFDSSLEFKPALPVPKLPNSGPKPTGLQGLLASIDGKKKLSTMEKSRHDWGNFKDKQDEHTRDEMERFAKDGYLAKVAFLERTDQRQAQVARSNRRKGMGLKD